MNQAQPGRDGYTVAWICALLPELSACRLMFDAIYDSPGRRIRSDSNAYVCGRIGGNNVVAACFPHGTKGNNVAATVTANLLASFPNVRFGLLVGVGGGIPSKSNDIRLGDVVVSSPEGTEGKLHHRTLCRQPTDLFFRGCNTIRFW